MKAQQLGQHFLKNAAALKKIAAALSLEAGDPVIEIGPGHGELTKYLLAEKISITAIEKDSVFAEALRQEFNKNADIKIVEGDALKILQPTIAHLMENAGHKIYKLAGNIPYYITGKLLRVLSEATHKPERAVLLLQREVAERICAAPPKMNRLAASVQFWAEPKIISVVLKEEFSPPPKVDSAIILLKTTLNPPAIAPDRYYAAVRAIFAQPRKTILNNATAGNNRGLTKAAVSHFLEQNRLSPTERPQNLTVQDISIIAQGLF